MGWFGFDFNGDDNVSFTEHMFTMDMMGFFDSEEKNADYDDDILDDAEVVSESDYALEDMDVQTRLDELESTKSDLEDALFNLEMNEPDILSPVYDSWSEHRDALQEQIDQLDSDISELEDLL